MIPPGRLVSPQTPTKKRAVLVPDPTAPLSGWYPFQSFSSELMCREWLHDFLTSPPTERDSLLKRVRKPEILRDTKPAERRFLLSALPSGQCIAADDPRIKGVQ